MAGVDPGLDVAEGPAGGLVRVRVHVVEEPVVVAVLGGEAADEDPAAGEEVVRETEEDEDLREVQRVLARASLDCVHHAVHATAPHNRARACGLMHVWMIA